MQEGNRTLRENNLFPQTDITSILVKLETRKSVDENVTHPKTRIVVTRVRSSWSMRCSLPAPI